MKQIVVLLVFCTIALIVPSTHAGFLKRLFKTGEEAPELTKDYFVEVIKKLADKHPHIKESFKGGKIGEEVKTLEHLKDSFREEGDDDTATYVSEATKEQLSAYLAAEWGFPIDEACLDKEKYYYRTYDGSCNWMKKGGIKEGSYGQPFKRDFDQYSYADGASQPREGPNAREVSNTFFKRKERLYYDHTAVLLALIEFVLHDVTYSQDGLEQLEVPIPKGDEAYDPEGTGNAKFVVNRTVHYLDSGSSHTNPRENANMATAWLDLSALYGSTEKVGLALRSKKNGKLLTSTGEDGLEYLPFNTMGLKMNSRPGQKQSDLFAGGDPRTNEDWLLLAVHTLLLREHNRLCDMMVAKYPHWHDERIYQTTRLVMSSKFALIANAYQMTYWDSTMPWPRDDGFPLYRQLLGMNLGQMNAFHTYPWEHSIRPDGTPKTTSQEMTMVYRFHEFIINSLPIIDEHNNTLFTQNLLNSGYDARGFMKVGVDSVLRGMVVSDIPNFKSGVDESFRSAGKYRGHQFDIATWSIVHERERGLPTFNQYARAFNVQVPKPQVLIPVRNTFEDFSSDPTVVADLKRLYKTPDDVDLVVGTQLDETMFPGTTVPNSALIISLFSLFGLGNADRFSPGYAILQCIAVQKPANCTLTNALQELVWVANDPSKPNVRSMDNYWLEEMDFPAHGANLLWRLITENSGVDCVQFDPLFPADEKTNPVMCELPPHKAKKDNIKSIIQSIITVVAIAFNKVVDWLKANIKHVLLLLAIYYITKYIYNQCFNPIRPSKQIPRVRGLPCIGSAIPFAKDAKDLVTNGYNKYKGVFCIKVFALYQNVVTLPANMSQMATDPNLSLDGFLQLINMDKVLGQEYGPTNTKIISQFLDIQRDSVLPGFAKLAQGAASEFLAANVDSIAQANQSVSVNTLMYDYITYVMSRTIVGPVGYSNPKLLKDFQKFNTYAQLTLALSGFLPSKIAMIPVNIFYKRIEVIMVPIIAQRRLKPLPPNSDWLQILIDWNDGVQFTNQQISHYVAIIVFAGLINIKEALINAVIDIAMTPNVADEVKSISPDLDVKDINDPNSNWQVIRSAFLESLRLSATMTGPARLAVANVDIVDSNGNLKTVPKGQTVMSGSYIVQYDPSNYRDATNFVASRFQSSESSINSQLPPSGPGIGPFLNWGPGGPHICPGRWFAVQTVSILVKVLFSQYDVSLLDAIYDEKYTYPQGTCVRKEVHSTLKKTQKGISVSLSSSK